MKETTKQKIYHGFLIVLGVLVGVAIFYLFKHYTILTIFGLGLITVAISSYLLYGQAISYFEKQKLNTAHGNNYVPTAEIDSNDPEQNQYNNTHVHLSSAPNRTVTDEINESLGLSSTSESSSVNEYGGIRFSGAQTSVNAPHGGNSFERHTSSIENEMEIDQHSHEQRQTYPSANVQVSEDLPPSYSDLQTNNYQNTISSPDHHEMTGSSENHDLLDGQYGLNEDPPPSYETVMQNYSQFN